MLFYITNVITRCYELWAYVQLLILLTVMAQMQGSRIFMPKKISDRLRLLIQKKLPPLDLEQLPPGRHPKRRTGLSHGFITGLHGSYNVFQIIGDGFTSKVKLIIDRKSGQKHALKIIKSHDTLPDSEAKKIYENEYKILNKLGRADPVEIITVSRKTGITKYQIVMDFAKGSMLRDLIIYKSLAYNDYHLMQICLEILLDLFTLHLKGILLIDDKTENMFLSKISDNPKTFKITRVDFGFAKDGYDFIQDSGFTTGFRGTLACAAPESKKYWRTKPATFNSTTEIYTVGIALDEILGEIIKNRYPQIKELINSMLSVNPTDRPTLEYAIEIFEKRLRLTAGSSIARLKEKYQPTETTASIQVSVEYKPTQMEEQKLVIRDDTVIQAGPTLSSTSSIQRSLECKKPVEAVELKTAITDKVFNQAYAEYEKEKDKFLGLRWLLANESTLTTIRKIENNRNENLRYQKVKDFISQNPHSRFAKKLASATGDAELQKIIQNAPSRWRSCI